MNENPSSAWKRLYLTVAVTAATFVAVAAINAVVNPYGAWPIAVVDRIYVRSDNVQRMTVPYQLTIARPHTVLIGSSRVMYGIPIEQGQRDGTLNASLPAAGLDDVGAVVDAARQPSLRRFVWGVDYFAFTDASIGVRDPKVIDRFHRKRAQLVRETLLSMEVLRASGRVLGRVLQGRSALAPTRRAPIPWPPELIAETFARERDTGMPTQNIGTRALFNEWIPPYASARVSAERWDAFRAILSRAERDSVEALLFVAPFSATELELIVQSGHWESFLEWKRDLAAVHPYWDFSGYDLVTTDEHLYLDPVHYKPAVGHLILRHLLGADCGDCGGDATALLAAGVRVDAHNVEAHLQQAAADVIRYRQPDGPAAQTVAALLEQSSQRAAANGAVR